MCRTIIGHRKDPGCRYSFTRKIIPGKRGIYRIKKRKFMSSSRINVVNLHYMIFSSVMESGVRLIGCIKKPGCDFSFRNSGVLEFFDSLLWVKGGHFTDGECFFFRAINDENLHICVAKSLATQSGYRFMCVAAGEIIT